MEDKIDTTPQKLQWRTILTADDFTTARAKADAVKGKVKRRPNGKFEVRIGTKVGKTEPTEPEGTAS